MARRDYMTNFFNKKDAHAGGRGSYWGNCHKCPFKRGSVLAKWWWLGYESAKAEATIHGPAWLQQVRKDAA